jgi:hypothetical protein
MPLELPIILCLTSLKFLRLKSRALGIFTHPRLWGRRKSKQELHCETVQSVIMKNRGKTDASWEF